MCLHFSSVTQSCPALWDPMDCSTPGFPVFHHLPELAQTHVHWVSDAIQPSGPLSTPSPPAYTTFPSIRVLSNESILRIRWPKYWSFSISPSSEYSGLISFRIYWVDLLAVQVTLKSPLQHHSSKVLTHEKMLNITHYQRNANQNHNEVPLHTSQNGCDPKICKQ